MAQDQKLDELTNLIQQLATRPRSPPPQGPSPSVMEEVVHRAVARAIAE